MITKKKMMMMMKRMRRKKKKRLMMMMTMMTIATRKMKKINKQQLKSPIPNPNPNFSDWAGLPEPLLLLILGHLTSVVDLLSSAASCRSWRSAAAAAASLPPLLVYPTLSSDNAPPNFRLQTLNLSEPFPCMSLPQSLCRSFIGYSHSHLISLLSPYCLHRRHVILSDVFTGRELPSPPILPSDPRTFYFSFAIATVPPSSSSCWVLIVARYEDVHTFLISHCILCWQPGSSKWSELKLGDNLAITSLIAFRGAVYGVDALYRLVVVEFVPCLSWRLLPAQLSPVNYLLPDYHRHHLVECDGELLVVLVILLRSRARVEVHCLDLSTSVWVKKESLGDWGLFVDVVRKCAMARPNPGRWGGQSNSVYVARPGCCNGWGVFPLDGKLIDVGKDSAIGGYYFSHWSWPSPFWVYPSMLL